MGIKTTGNRGGSQKHLKMEMYLKLHMVSLSYVKYQVGQLKGAVPGETIKLAVAYTAFSSRYKNK